MATPEEVTTQRFYLRKIEGAEVLLAFETNFFRQELHKWAPLGPEPPPILEHSHSTRKPRPTKAQKMMVELGIENPDDLPLKFRTKQQSTFAKSRKSSDSHSTKTPQPLQPAPQFNKRSDTPLSLTHSASTGNGPSSQGPPHRVPQPISTTHADSPYSAYYSMHSPSGHHNQQHYGNTSPTFAWQNRGADHNPSPGLSHSPGFAPNSPIGRSGPPLDPGLFSPTQSQFNASALRDGSGPPYSQSLPSSLISPIRDHFGHSHSNSGSNIDNVFADFVNEAGEENGRNEAGEALEEREMDLDVREVSGDDEERERRLAEEFLNH